MGNTFNKDNDTINWNSLKTENVNDENGQLTNDSKLLLNRLQLDLPDKLTKSESDSEINNFFSKYKTIESSENQKSLQQIQNNNEENLSDTSPFISSDMYKYLMKSTVPNEEMKGGGVIDGDDSSTSSTSSSSDEKKTKPKKISKTYKNKKQINKKQLSKKDSSEELSEESSVQVSENYDEQGLSYVSSSAHTGGGDSENNSENDSNNESDYNESNNKENTEQSGGEEYESSSENVSSEESSLNESEESSSVYISSPIRATSTVRSKTNTNKKNYKSKSLSKSITNENSELPPSSINTSDINMITEN